MLACKPQVEETSGWSHREKLLHKDEANQGIKDTLVCVDSQIFKLLLRILKEDDTKIISNE